MPFRQLCIVSINKRSLIYVRRFANNDNRAIKCGAQSIDFDDEQQFVNSLLSSLSIHTNPTEFDCVSTNQLPVIEFCTESQRIWPVIVVETNGYLFTGFPLCQTNSKQLIDHNSIALCFTCLQLIANYFSIENGSLSWIEWFITCVMPFGTLISYNYRPFAQQLKLENKQINENAVNITIKELISANKDQELLYGTISVDNTNLTNIDKLYASINLINIERMSLVLPQNCELNGSNIDVSLNEWHNPLSLIHYKCNSNPTDRKRVLNYNYKITKIPNQNNYFRIQLSIQMNSNAQIRFNYFNILFKCLTENKKTTLEVIKPDVSFGQLKQESIGIFWVIGNKFPKSGNVNLSFDLICSHISITDIETKSNYSIQNVHTNQYFSSEYEHLRIGSIKLVPKEFHLNIESSITTVDYKLIPNISNEFSQ